MSTPRKPYAPRRRQAQTMDTLRQRTIEVGECWEWQGRYTSAGYPTARHQGATVLVRRLIYGLGGRELRPAPAWVIVTTCGNARCVNPEHLRQIRLVDQIRRMATLGNHNDWARSAKIAATKRAKYAKLDEAAVADIRTSGDTTTVLAERYGVNASRIKGIRSGRMWRDFSSPWGGLVRGLA